MSNNIFTALLAVALAAPMTAQTVHQLTLDTLPVAEIQPTMYGVFFEDINFGADGGLYAEMVENRSFEFPQNFMGWTTFGNVSIGEKSPAFDRNPHYVTLESSGHAEKRTGLENHGFFGMGLRRDMTYDFSVYARLHLLNGKQTQIRVQLISPENDVISSADISIDNNKWQRYTARLASDRTCEKASLRIYLIGEEGIDLDHVSLFPTDNWHGLRADLVKDLEDMHPGILRFPGGCIVEGTDLATRYQWKNSVGPAENRPLNENRWNYTFVHRLYPNYFQTYGLGFYEFFMLCERIGAEPLPVLSVGLACQYQNNESRNSHVAVADLQPYIDDALDLIEFANGAATTKWGALRASMGHPEPFGMKQIAIGNEQWGKVYVERLKPFVEQIRSRYPDIKICGSSGPSPDGDKFDYLWGEMRSLNIDLVDEHYYCSPDWFYANAARYDNYDRRGPKVFCGEYASHIDDKGIGGDVARNTFAAALSEAAFMTGLERNADVVHQATYAPLFAHVEGWQWRPDLIWFNNTESVRSANWYVQMLYSTNRGTSALRLTEGGKPLTGQDGLYASAVYDKAGKAYIVKIVNGGDAASRVKIDMSKAKITGTCHVVTLHSDAPNAVNSLAQKQCVVPSEAEITVDNKAPELTIGAKTFSVYRFATR